MNRLAVRRSGLLVSRSFLQQRKLAVGDDLMLTVAVENKFVQIPFTILGTFDLFPTYYPAEGALFIANLDYLVEKMGGEYPYHVWLKTEAGISSNQIVSDLRQRSFTIVTTQDARLAITDQQSAPERQGIFGLLSVGFFTAALLTVLGYIVYEVVGFQRRFIELGMLRALGLSTWQMIAHLASEQAMLILTGLGVGTLVGYLASRVFIPFLQAGASQEALVPPFIVRIAWNQVFGVYAIFALMLVTAVLILTLFLTRMKVFEAVKLGETI
jgi:putative ABC transport system permease protein